MSEQPSFNLTELAKSVEHALNLTISATKKSKAAIGATKKLYLELLEQTEVIRSNVYHFISINKVTIDQAETCSNVLRKLDILDYYHHIYLKDLKIFETIDVKKLQKIDLDLIERTLKRYFVTFVTVKPATKDKKMEIIYMNYLNKQEATDNGDVRFRVVLDRKNNLICSEMEQNYNLILNP